jgi:hypothetical protein
MTQYTPLTGSDLISNEPLRAKGGAPISDADDVFQHRRIAQRVAQLIAAPGTNVNIAVNAPWGSGKSSFFGLLKEELENISRVGEKAYEAVDFDAWQMADDTFESNFLATVAEGVKNSPKNIEQRLFRANRTITLPLGMDVSDRLRKPLKWFLVVMTVLFVFGIPAIQVATDAHSPVVHDAWGFFWMSYMPRLVAWLGAAAGGTLLVVIIGTVTNLWKVQVQESGPAHVTQFRKLFAHILRDTTSTQVILIDELDRCEPQSVMRTLEGLRRFLGSEKCVFVVAFDRESVVETVQTELARKIPARPGRPYYSTAGEYLDKIFTYQVALPPQPRKAFRKFATDLVNKKTEAGVWAELRAANENILDEVLSILSPPHLTSPRRTKVILNDFAINARIAESYDVDWTARAQEMAVLTVLQTEFPIFYADLEHYPNLLAHVSRRATNMAGENLRPVLNKYLTEGAAPEKVLTEEDDETRFALRSQLSRFLQKLNDMQVTLPGADLIQLGAGKQMLDFEDPSIFAAVEAATEVPRHETLARLRAARPSDLLRAVQIMLADIEGETSAEATTLRVLVGTLLPALEPNQRAGLIPQLTAAWERIVATETVDQLSVDATKGYLGTLAPSKDPQWVSDALHAANEDVNLHTPALETLTTAATDDAITQNHSQFLRSALDLVPEPSEPFIAVLRRLDAAGLALHIGSAPADELRELLDTDEVAENDEETIQRTRDLVQSLLDLVGELPPASTIRVWIIGILRGRALERGTAISDADYIHIIDAGLASDANRAAAVTEALLALSKNPLAALREHLVARVHADVDVDAELLMPALTTLLEMVAEDLQGTNDATHRAIANIVTLAGSKDVLDPRRILGAVEILYTSSALLPRRRHDFFLDVAHSLMRLPSLTSEFEVLLATLAVNSVRALPDGAQAVHVLQGLAKESARTVGQVADQLTELLPGKNGERKWIIDTILCAHHRLHQLGHPLSPLTVDRVDPYISQSGDQGTLGRWIETGPPAAAVTTILRGAALGSVSEATWKTYSARASVADATALWESAVETGQSSGTLSALASGGISVEARTEAGRQMSAATNSVGREAAFHVFSTLPADKLTATAVTEPLIAWLADARKSDAWMVVDLLDRHRYGFDSAELTEVRLRIPEWFESVGPKLSIDRQRRLAEAGYIRRTRKHQQ